MSHIYIYNTSEKFQKVKHIDHTKDISRKSLIASLLLKLFEFDDYIVANKFLLHCQVCAICVLIDPEIFLTYSAVFSFSFSESLHSLDLDIQKRETRVGRRSFKINIDIINITS